MGSIAVTETFVFEWFCFFFFLVVNLDLNKCKFLT